MIEKILHLINKLKGRHYNRARIPRYSNNDLETIWRTKAQPRLQVELEPEPEWSKTVDAVFDEFQNDNGIDPINEKISPFAPILHKMIKSQQQNQ